MPISTGIDPMLTALRASAAASAASAMQGAAAPVATAVMTESEEPAEVAAKANPASTTKGRATKGASQAAPEAPSPTEAPSGPCGEARRIADERCELATRARARRSRRRTPTGQRSVPTTTTRPLAEAAASADARAIRQAKDQARRFARGGPGRAPPRTSRTRHATGSTRSIGSTPRPATRPRSSRARALPPEMAVRLERTAVEADGARVAAEAAEAACVAARQAVADCEERAAGTVRVRHRPARATIASGRHDVRHAGGRSASRASPRIVRLLRGDRTAMHEVVDALGGDDADERRRWQVAMADLTDAIVADAIAASAFDFPTDHPFWGPFNRSQGRDIAAALSSSVIDSMGSAAGSTSVPVAARPVARARLCRARPDAHASLAERRRDGDAVPGGRGGRCGHLANTAGDLTLGELVAMLGRRADGLADIWNEWGRIRPVLLDER